MQSSYRGATPRRSTSEPLDVGYRSETLKLPHDLALFGWLATRLLLAWVAGFSLTCGTGHRATNSMYEVRLLAGRPRSRTPGAPDFLPLLAIEDRAS